MVEIDTKVVVLGDSGVGKTSIILRFTRNEFTLTQNTTIGASFLTRTVNYPQKNKTINYQIWDTAGQEKFATLANLYYRDARVCIIVYDITDRKTFVVMKKWIDEIKQKGPEDIILCFVGNKIDMEDNEVIGISEGISIAKEHNAIFNLTSAKENKGIDNLFEKISEKIIGDNPKPAPSKSIVIKKKDDDEKKKHKKCCDH